MSSRVIPTQRAETKCNVTTNCTTLSFALHFITIQFPTQIYIQHQQQTTSVSSKIHPLSRATRQVLSKRRASTSGTRCLVRRVTYVNDVVGVLCFQFAFFCFGVCGECFSTGIVFVDQGILVSFPYLPIDQPFERLATLSNPPSDSQVRYRPSTPPRRAFEGVIRSSRSQLQ